MQTTYNLFSRPEHIHIKQKQFFFHETYFQATNNFLHLKQRVGDEYEDFHASVVFSFCSFCAPGLRLATVARQPGKFLRVSRPASGSRLRKNPRWSSFFSENFASENQSEIRRKQFHVREME